MNYYPEIFVAFSEYLNFKIVYFLRCAEMYNILREHIIMKLLFSTQKTTSCSKSTNFHDRPLIQSSFNFDHCKARFDLQKTNFENFTKWCISNLIILGMKFHDAVVFGWN